MKIKFLGAVGGHVTGSCHLVHTDAGDSFLVDCGALQGRGGEFPASKGFPFDPRTISFVLLTHAHADHCGRIPDLYACGFRGKIISTEATRDLAILNFLDGAWREMPEGEWPEWRKSLSPEDLDGLSAEQKEEKEKERRKTRKKKRAEWEKSETEKWEARFRYIDREEGFQYGIYQFIAQDAGASFLRSSHMLGAVSIDLALGIFGQPRVQNICFSGDIGNLIDLSKKEESDNYLALLRDGHVPNENNGYIVMEATSGAQEPKQPEHKDFVRRIGALKDTLATKGVNTFVFACFAMQRTQDVLFDLVYAAQQDDFQEKVPGEMEIILDSPMGIKACEIYKRHLVAKRQDGRKYIYRNGEFAKRFTSGDEEAADEVIQKVLSGNYNENGVKVVFGKRNSRKESKKENSENNEKKTIYITSSGMLAGGPVIEHLHEKMGKPDVGFVITGFQVPDLGKKLQAWAGKPPEERDGGATIPAQNGKKEKKIKGRETKAVFFNLAPYYSGHADSDGLMRFLFHTSKRTINMPAQRQQCKFFLVHGQTEARQGIKEKIAEKREAHAANGEASGDLKNPKVELPNAGDPFFDLNKGEWDPHFNLPLLPHYFPSESTGACLLPPPSPAPENKPASESESGERPEKKKETA